MKTKKTITSRKNNLVYTKPFQRYFAFYNLRNVRVAFCQFQTTNTGTGN